MGLIAMCAAKGSPGVTVTSLALTMSWSGSVILAECDPSGSSVQPGYLAGQLPADRGLSRLAVAERHGRLIEDFAAQLIDLGTDASGHSRWLLPGISDPANAVALGPVWPRLAAYLAQLETAQPPFDVIADCGRLPALFAPLPLLHHADVVVLLVQPTMASVAAARPRAAMLRRDVAEQGLGTLRLIIVGAGPYSAHEVSAELDVPVMAELPEDVRTARMLSNGTGTPRSKAPLMRAAGQVQHTMRCLIDERRAGVGFVSGVSRG